MKLTLESFFQPGEHDNDADGHRFPRPPRTVGTNDFPYTQDAGDCMSDEEIEEELNLESLSLVEFYKTSGGRTMPGGAGMSAGKMQNSAGGAGGGKSSKGWQGAGRSPNVNLEDPVEADSTTAHPIDMDAYREKEDYEVFDDYFGLSEAIGARERATKEGGPLSTKQPWQSGVPGSEPNYTTVSDVDPNEEREELERDIGLALDNTYESIPESRMSLEKAYDEAKDFVIKEYSTDDFSRHQTHKRATREEDDLYFWDEVTNGSPYIWNSEREFRDRERKRNPKKKKEESEE